MAKIYADARFGIRSDTLENWLESNPVLEDGEPSYVKNADGEDWLKIGDGVTAWRDLPYRKGPKGESVDKNEVADILRPDINSQIDKALGDIDAALDEIIALQEEYIGRYEV